MCRENGAPAGLAELSAEIVRHTIRMKLVGAVGKLQVRLRNFDIDTERSASCLAADRAMADTDVCRRRFKFKTYLLAETVS